MPVVPTGAVLAPPEEAALCLEEVAPPASGTRKARVLYDYEAADSSELALLADEVGPEGQEELDRPGTQSAQLCSFSWNPWTLGRSCGSQGK